MSKVRIMFTKLAEVKFLSHLDTSRTITRAVRRADIPIAYSEGFNPHPKMSFGQALPVGTTSESEYLDMDLKHEMEPTDVQDALNSNLPAGIRVRMVKKLSDKSAALGSVIKGARYKGTAKTAIPVSADELEMAIKNVVNSPELSIERITKKGNKNIKVNQYLSKIDILDISEDEISFNLLVSIDEKGSLRPEEIISVIAQFIPLSDLKLASIHRIGLVSGNGEEIKDLD